MILDSQDLNIAYDELMTWGPRLGMPLIPRIQERLPHASLEYALLLEKECRAAQNLANDLCEQAYFEKIPHARVRTVLLENFPWINEENFNHAYSQGGYYAWHG